MPEEVRDYFKQQGAKGGKLGGKKRMESLTAEERSALAKKAVTAREKKRKAVKKKSKSS